MHQHTPDQTYVWADVFTNAVNAFEGQRPTQQLEHDLIQHFERQPAELVAAIAKTATRFQLRKIHSPWPIVLRELEQADERHTIAATDTMEKRVKTRLAETWMRNAGLYCPTRDDALDELFGDHGSLKTWADDQALRAHMGDLWEHEHPRAEQAEAESRARAAAHRDRRNRPATDTPSPTPATTHSQPSASPDADLPL
jgi:hypothetical protein